MDVTKVYRDVVKEAECGNEVLFWQEVANAVGRMSPYVTGHVSVMFTGENGKRSDMLSGTHRETIKPGGPR